MRKTIVFGIAVIMTLTASVTTFAHVSAIEADHNHHESVELTSQGTGACRHAGCKCTWYIRAQGGAGKCVCGHWDYVHN